MNEKMIYKTHESRLEEEVIGLQRTNNFKRSMTLLNIVGMGNLKINDRMELVRLVNLENSKCLVDVIQKMDVKRAYEICSQGQRFRKSFLYVKTQSEYKVFDLIKKSTKKKFYRSLTFGGGVLDGYIPSLGLGIEVEGGVHDNDKKMIKDNIKFDQAKILGMKMYSIQNFNPSHLNYKNFSPTVLNFIHYINKVPTLNSRKQMELLFKIWIYSIVSIDVEIALDIFSIDKQTLDACTFHIEKLRAKHGLILASKEADSRYPLIRL